jgi:hypothetical protein
MLKMRLAHWLRRNRLNEYKQIKLRLDRIEQMVAENYKRAKHEKRIRYFIDFDAGLSTARFVQEKMPNLQPLESRFALLSYALDEVNLDGLLLEFGVFQGETIRHIAGYTKKCVHGFDSFEGLPEPGGVSQRAGNFDLAGRLPEVPENVTLHKGWFPDTLPAFFGENDQMVAFAHIDCDIYSSTKTVLDHIAARLAVGTVIVFDEYFNFPDWQNHEHKAFTELVATRDIAYSYIGRTDSRQLAIRINRNRPR